MARYRRGQFLIYMWKFILGISIIFLAVSCSKQTTFNVPKPIIKSSVIKASSSPEVLSATIVSQPSTTPISIPKPKKVVKSISLSTTPIISVPVIPTTIPVLDVCGNIEGSQTVIPVGMIADGQGNCIVPPPTPVSPIPQIIYVPSPQSAPTPVSNPYANCGSEEQQISQQITASVSASGGFMTNSQLQAMIMNKMYSEGYSYCY